MDFPFHQIYGLDDYNSQYMASVFFGMYRHEDIALCASHKAQKICFWTGQDALDATASSFDEDIKNVTAHPKIYERIKSFGFDCELVKPSTFLNTVRPQKLGKRIYAYCPNSAPDYHGKKVLDELRRGGYEIVIGDGQFSQDEWRHGVANMHYHDIFVGLCLSSFAGGGTSIIEMGLRGIPVITNVFNLPNCIPWTDAQGIANEIDRLKTRAGLRDGVLANEVWRSLDHDHKWLEI